MFGDMVMERAAPNVMIFVSPQGLWITGRAVTYVSPPAGPVKTSVSEIDRVRTTQMTDPAAKGNDTATAHVWCTIWQLW